jgi:hypothetical protein
MKSGVTVCAGAFVAPVIACVLLAAGARPAQATLAYGLAVMRIENFKITGVTPVGAGSRSGGGTSATYTPAEEAGFGSGDPNHATNGPGPFPGENDFFAGGGLGGDGGRADTAVTFNTPPPAGFHPADLIAEAQRSTPGDAGGKAMLELSMDVVQATAAPMKIDFHAIVELLAQAEGSSTERAVAQAGYVMDIAILSADGQTTYLTWSYQANVNPSYTTPQGGTVSDVVQPFHMQKLIRTALVGPGSDSAAFSNNGDFSLSFNWGAGIDFRVVAKLEVFADAIVVANPIPEPGTCTLLAGGLIGFALLLVRRRAAPCKP